MEGDPYELALTVLQLSKRFRDQPSEAALEQLQLAVEALAAAVRRLDRSGESHAGEECP